MRRSDPLTPQERSARMARVRARGNASTELAVEYALDEAGIAGWVKHPADVVGKPDFFFPALRTALFVDGCFWHGCPKCRRRFPRSRRAFWERKLLENRARDLKVRRKLRRQGFHAVCVWEHEARRTSWVGRLRAVLARASDVRARGDGPERAARRASHQQSG